MARGLPASPRMVTGFHRFTLENFSLCKGIGVDKNICSGSFNVGGHEWALSINPDGSDSPLTNGEGIYLSIRIGRMSGCDGKVGCLFKITLLDQTGKGNHKTLSSSEDDGITISPGCHFGYPFFIRRDLPENSCYFKDDCLKIECELSVLLKPSEHPPSNSIGESIVVVDGINFLPLLESGEGFDVSFHVRGNEFRAHKVILSARSSVFNSMFATNLNSDHSEKVIITGIEPRVFKAVLHFIYTDNLPEDEECLAGGYAFGPSVSNTFVAKLLAAADEYDLSRLKTICEAYLWRSISFARFVETLSLAKRYKASKLHSLCLQYASRNYEVLMDVDSFANLIKKQPLLLKGVDGYLLKERQLN